MNPNEAAQFLQAVARAHPGKVTYNRTIAAQWATDLAGISLDDANLAWATWRCDPTHAGHVLEARDVIAAHRTATGDPTARPRPEIAPSRITVAGPREAPDIAHAELAKMRAILGEASPYSGRRR